MTAPTLFPKLDAYLEGREASWMEIPEARRRTLARVAAFVRAQAASDRAAELLFICTHNSRRSHMGQLWAQASAVRAGHLHVKTFSGGTEATALNPRAAAALERAGFEIHAAPGEGENPRYQVGYAAGAPPMEAFSKTIGQPPNPTEGFVAIMTCDQADAACPIVSGATVRVSLPYVDPKVADDTDEEAATYDLRASQIATEMAYLASRI